MEREGAGEEAAAAAAAGVSISVSMPARLAQACVAPMSGRRPAGVELKHCPQNWRAPKPGTPRKGSPAPRVSSPSLAERDRKSTTSELQSQSNLVCRLLLEKKKNRIRR